MQVFSQKVISSQISLPQTSQRFILDPFQLFISQLQTSKDIKGKKQSIQTLDQIVLTMSQKQIIQSLLPYLTKLLTEENNKDLKISIIKSFGNILQFLSKQKHLLAYMEMTFDIFLVFQEQEIKLQTINIIETLMFSQSDERGKFGLISFEKFKKPLRKLLDQSLIDFASTDQLVYYRNSKQLILYIVKYFLINSSQLKDQQIQYYISYLKSSFLHKVDDQYLSLQILSENFYFLVSSWPLKFFQHLNFFIKVLLNIKDDKKQQKNQNPIHESQIILSQNSQRSQISQNKPQKEHKVIQNSVKTLQSDNFQIPSSILQDLKINLIPVPIQICKKLGNASAYQYLDYFFKQLQSNIKIKVALIKRFKQLISLFQKQNLQPLLSIFKKFTEQTQEVKKAILEIFDQIPFLQGQKTELIVKNCKNSIQLKNLLIQTLIQSSQVQNVGQIINQSDYDFKIKIFIKLPDSLLSKNTIYSSVVDSLLSEPKKNFRSKLNLIQNIITRIQDKINPLTATMPQNFDVSYLITMLVKYFSDKIALVRTNIAKLCALILYFYEIDFEALKKDFQQSFYGQNKNWFQRQNVLLTIKQYLEINQKFKNTKSQALVRYKNPKFYELLTRIIKDSILGIACKSSGKEILPQKIQIKIITNLAQDLHIKYSLSY